MIDKAITSLVNSPKQIYRLVYLVMGPIIGFNYDLVLLSGACFFRTFRARNIVRLYDVISL